MARELAVEFGEHKVMPLARRNSVPAEASRGRAVDDEARARKRLEHGSECGVAYPGADNAGESLLGDE
jgi:hypothetical protein